MDNNFNVIMMKDGKLHFHGFEGLTNRIVIGTGRNSVFIKNHIDTGIGADSPVFNLDGGVSDSAELAELLKGSLDYHFCLTDGVYYQSHISADM